MTSSNISAELTAQNYINVSYGVDKFLVGYKQREIIGILATNFNVEPHQVTFNDGNSNYYAVYDLSIEFINAWNRIQRGDTNGKVGYKEIQMYLDQELCMDILERPYAYNYSAGNKK